VFEKFPKRPRGRARLVAVCYGRFCDRKRASSEKVTKKWDRGRRLFRFVRCSDYDREYSRAPGIFRLSVPMAKRAQKRNQCGYLARELRSRQFRLHQLSGSTLTHSGTNIPFARWRLGRDLCRGHKSGLPEGPKDGSKVGLLKGTLAGTLGGFVGRDS